MDEDGKMLEIDLMMLLQLVGMWFFYILVEACPVPNADFHILESNELLRSAEILKGNKVAGLY